MALGPVTTPSSWAESALSTVRSLPGVQSLISGCQNISPAAGTSALFGVVTGLLTGNPLLGFTAAASYGAYTAASRVYTALCGTPREHIPPFAQNLQQKFETACPEDAANLPLCQQQFSQRLDALATVTTPELCEQLAAQFNQTLNGHFQEMSQQTLPFNQLRACQRAKELQESARFNPQFQTFMTQDVNNCIDLLIGPNSVKSLLDQLRRADSPSIAELTDLRTQLQRAEAAVRGNNELSTAIQEDIAQCTRWLSSSALVVQTPFSFAAQVCQPANFQLFLEGIQEECMQQLIARDEVPMGAFIQQINFAGIFDQEDRYQAIVHFHAFLRNLRGNIPSSSQDPAAHRLTQLLAAPLATASPLAQEMERLLFSSDPAAENYFRTQLAQILGNIRLHLHQSYATLTEIYCEEIKQRYQEQAQEFARLQLESTGPQSERALENIRRRLFDPQSLLAQAQAQFTEHAPHYSAYAKSLCTALNAATPFSSIEAHEFPSHRAIAYETSLTQVRELFTQLAEKGTIDPESITAKTARTMSKIAYHNAIEPIQTQMQPVLDQVERVAKTANAINDTVQGSIIPMARSVGEWIQPSANNATANAAAPAQNNGLLDRILTPIQPVIDFVRPLLGGNNPTAQEGEMTLAGMIAFAARHLIHAEGDVALTQRLFSFGMVFFNVLQRAQAEVTRHSANNPAFTPIVEEINACITRLNEAITQQNAQHFQAAMQEGMQILERVNVYGNTHALPGWTNFLTIPLSGLINSIFGETGAPEVNPLELPAVPLGLQSQALANAMNSSSEQRQLINPANIDAEILKQKEIFVTNMTQTVALKLICGFCRVQSEGVPLYLQMIREANTPGVERNSKTLWRVVERNLQEQKVGWVKRKLAWALYHVADRIVKSIAQRAMTRALGRFFKWIDQNKNSHFAGFRNGIIHNSNSYFTILNGIFRQIGIEQNFTGEVKQEVANRLSQKKYNGGYTNNELYSKFTDVALKTISGNWFLDLFNGIHLLKFVVRTIIGRDSLAKDVISNGSEFFVDQNGYSHALNCVLYDQLLDIWTQLNRPDAAPDNDAEILKNLSENVKKEITGLVKNVMEFLYIDPNATPGDLQAMVKRNSPTDLLQRGADSLFIDDVILAASDQIAVTFHTLLNENKIKQLFYDFTSKVNDNYKKGDAAVPTQEFTNKEAQLRELSQQILTFIVRKAVNEALQFTREDEQRQVNQLISELKTDLEGTQTEGAPANGFLANTQGHLGELLAMPDLTTPEARRKVQTVGETTHAFLHKWHRKCVEIRGAQMSDQNKTMLTNLIELELSRNLTQFHLRIAALIEKSNQTHASAKIIPAIRASENALGTIDNILRGSRDSLQHHQDAYRQAILQMESQQERLRQTPSAAPIVQRLREYSDLMGSQFNRLSQHPESREQMQNTLASYLGWLAAERQQHELVQGTRRAELSHLIEDAQNAIGPVQNWVNNSLRPIAFLNLSVLPNGSIRRQANTFVYNRIHHKFSRSLDFLRDPVFCYRFGLHHLLLIPSVGKKAPPKEK